MPAILSVALPTPLRKHFDYLPPSAGTPQIGCRVQVPFGRQILIGVITGISNIEDRDKSAPSVGQLKPALSLLDEQPLLPQNIMTLCLWAANYYQHALGDIINTALPAGLRAGDPAVLPEETIWSLTTKGLNTQPDTLKRAPKQAATLRQLQSLSAPVTGSITSEATTAIGPDEIATFNIDRKIIKRLEEKQLLTSTTEIPRPNRPELLLNEPRLNLNDEQHTALNAIAFGKFGTHLLYGTTGSGKTEVYMQAIETVLNKGQQALILIPEIGLTPQLLNRFRARFNRPLALHHSGLSDGERKNNWLRAKAGHIDIVIGTRSAVFTPLPNPGIIIIDEEHDISFKQQDSFRYSARDLAAIRAQNLNIPLILGSATPSLESFHNAEQGRYQLLRLHARAGQAQAPNIQVLDIRKEKLNNGISRQAINSIAATLNRSEQALVFINRRGFAPTLMCHDCGWVAQCPHCDARLTVHQYPNHLHCHHCDYQHPLITRCLQCHSKELHCLGQGSVRTEQCLQELFTDTPVIRVDRDSTRRKNAMQDIMDQVNSGKPCILVGTQMLAKGHHFPNVTLVVILDADNGLFSSDFRGPERTGQLLLQVSGRAGRAEKPGHVLIQTHLCDHPLLTTLLENGYSAFMHQILQERQLGQMPPFQYIALLRAEAKFGQHAVDFLQTARQLAEQIQPSTPQLQYLGPLPAPMERRNQRFRFQLQIKAESRGQLHQLLQPLISELDKLPQKNRVRWSVDIDPLDMN